MNSLRNIIQRCHQRHEKPLRQKKTIVTPAIYKGLLYHFTVYCAQRCPVRLYDLEQAGISFMPVGGGPECDRVPQSFGGERFLARQRMEDWEIRQWHASWGIQVYTGIPSERDGAPWHDIEFTYQAICAAPDAVLACIETLMSTVANPLLTLTKSGSLRFSCRLLDYLHPDTEEARFYIYKDVPTVNDSYQRDVYLEILGEAGHSPWDARCEILRGDLLNPPLIAKEMLFTAVDVLREELHEPDLLRTEKPKSTPEVLTPTLLSLGSYRLDLAKEAFLKRGFSYLGEENGFHYWRKQGREENDIDVLLWELDGKVWLRASMSGVGLPTEDTLITDVWDDTGILLPNPGTGLVGSEKMLAVREGKLSPLAIKRPTPVLQKPEDTESVYEPLEKNIDDIQSVFDSDARVIGLVAETGARHNYEVESYLLEGGAVSFSSHFPIVEEAMGHFQRRNLPSVVRWRHVTFRWDQVKDIPVDVRMAIPFERGNVCEDPERFIALLEKGIDPRETLCPRCPVYTVCQERGYLSQSATLQRAKTQIFGAIQTYLDPRELTATEELLEPVDGTERLHIIDEIKINEMFLGCSISKDRLEAWRVNWQGKALGSFTQTLLNALEIKDDPDNLVVKRVRAVMRVFQQHEEAIIRQMCRINVGGRVVVQGIADEESGKELARFTVEFEGGVSAYIPLDGGAAERLTAKGLPIFEIESFVINEDLKIPMSIEQAIGLDILDIKTVKRIQEFPGTYRNPNWTFWHQLKRFFGHYTRDIDAPMIWYNNILEFWVPPVLHPSMKRLLLMSATLSERDFRRAFPGEDIETIRIKPAPWIAGNQVFQVRSGVYTLKTMLDYDSTWDVIGLSKMGERFLLGICAEIDRDPSVKHAIITYDRITEQLRDLTEKENVCLLTAFQDRNNLETAFEAAEVVWIVGTPYFEPGLMWWRAQIMYGNDKKPLSYEADTEFQHYKDERVQRIYTQTVADVITDIVGRAGLNRWNGKKVVLISSLEISNITDRPEVLLFDWEDFQVAGGLDKLAETITIRQRFEAERDQLTADTSRQEVERILGCSARQANRMLKKLRGGNIPRVTFREQILTLLADGEKKAADVVAAIDGNSHAIYHELRRLDEIGEIQKVGWGVYALQKQPCLNSNISTKSGVGNRSSLVQSYRIRERNLFVSY